METFKEIAQENQKNKLNSNLTKGNLDILSAFLALRKASVSVDEIAPVPTLASMVMVIKALKSNLKGPRIPFLEGPPGTGKTHFLEAGLPELMATLSNILKDRPSGHSESVKEVLEEFNKRMNIGFLSVFLNNENRVNKLVGNYNGELGNFLRRILLAIDMVEKSNIESDEKQKFFVSVSKFLADFLFSLTDEVVIEKRDEISKALSIPSFAKVEVLPSKESGESERRVRYITSREGLQAEYEHPFLDVLLKAYSGGPCIVIWDEISELPKNIPGFPRAKDYHDLMDYYLNPKFGKSGQFIHTYPLMIEGRKLSDEGRGVLEGIRDKYIEFLSAIESRNFGELYSLTGFVEPSEEAVSFLKQTLEEAVKKLDSVLNNRTETISFIIPSNLFIFATGNIRKKDDQVGFTESTEERIQRWPMSYMPPEQMVGFLKKLVDKVEMELMMENEERKYLETFGEHLGSLYRQLYEEFTNSTGLNLRNLNMLPTIRTMVSLVYAFSFYMILYNRVFGKDKKSVELENFYVFSPQFASSKVQFTKAKAALPSPDELLNFSTFLVQMMSRLRVGSFTTISEADAGAQMHEKELTESAEQLKKALNLAKPGLITSRDRFGKDFYLSRVYFNTLLTSAMFLLSGQRFILYIGTTQEGKTTMAKDILPEVLKGVIDKVNEVEEGDVDYIFPFSDVETVLMKAEDFTIRTPNLQTEKEGRKESITESPLLTIIRKANRNPSTLYVVVINEMDKLAFSQELNQLLSRDEVEVKGEKLSLKNVVFVGTMNVSERFLDNFISRSGVPFVFVPVLGMVEYQGFDVRLLHYLFKFVEEVRGGSDASEFIKNIIRPPRGTGYQFLSEVLKNRRFTELARIVPSACEGRRELAGENLEDFAALLAGDIKTSSNVQEVG